MHYNCKLATLVPRKWHFLHQTNMLYVCVFYLMSALSCLATYFEINTISNPPTSGYTGVYYPTSAFTRTLYLVHLASPRSVKFPRFCLPVSLAVRWTCENLTALIISNASISAVCSTDSRRVVPNIVISKSAPHQQPGSTSLWKPMYLVNASWGAGPVNIW